MLLIYKKINIWLRLTLTLVSLATLFIILLILPNESIFTNGRQVVLAAKFNSGYGGNIYFIDPGSYFRGFEVSLKYNIDEIDNNKRNITGLNELKKGDKSFLVIKPGADGNWKFDHLYTSRDKVPTNAVFITGRVRMINRNKIYIKYDISNLTVVRFGSDKLRMFRDEQQKKAKGGDTTRNLHSLPIKAYVRIGKNGKAIIDKLYSGNKAIYSTSRF